MTRIDNAAMSALCELYQPILMSLIPLNIASQLPEYHLTRLRNRQKIPKVFYVKSELDINDSFLYLSIATVDYHMIKLSFLVVGR